MLNFLRKKPPEVQGLLSRIDAAIRRLPEDLAPLGQPLLQKLAGTVKQQWKAEHERDYADQIRQGETHEAFIYNFLVHAVGDQLESGQHHVYRGVLSQVGIQYRSLFEHAINTMVEMNGYTQEWANENLRAAVYKGIREVG